MALRPGSARGSPLGIHGPGLQPPLAALLDLRFAQLFSPRSGGEVVHRPPGKPTLGRHTRRAGSPRPGAPPGTGAAAAWRTSCTTGSRRRTGSGSWRRAAWRRWLRRSKGGVAGGDARLVTDPLADVQGPAVQRLGGGVVPPQLGQHVEPVAEHGVGGSQLADGLVGGCHRLVCLPGGVVVVAGLQELVDVVLAALRDGADPPVPERRGPAVGLPGGIGMQLGDRPGRLALAVHEMQRALVAACHRHEQAGGPGRAHRGGQAFGGFDRRPQLLGEVGR